ncbi:Aldehyde dehydrogenase [Sphaceloma murrayae]|uniref:aldehyde dehydrogenase (NAD(+)) n=1 Tax=Sphaceloma murrayae TaxID=2082308 RepID=A0A2K1QID5_9PEZI|nr:Aldehyde dehydrogenase [Sphaceloma murrayae]
MASTGVGGILVSKPDKIETRLFINGKFKDASDGKTFKVINPATLEVSAEVAEATVEDTNEAVAVAKAAFPAWSELSPDDRGKPMAKMAQLIRENAGTFAYLEAISMGRPISQYYDFLLASDTWDIHSKTGWNAQGKASVNTPGIVGLTLRQPYGVVAGIIPWNAPLVTLSGQAAAALGVGNTVVIKSSEKAPLTSAWFATLINQAGFPPGVFNILSGHGTPCGATLSEHMDVRCISFTGSGRTGRLIQQAAARSNLKHVILELGGKSPLVVLDDCDLQKAIADATFSIQVMSGQTCIASSRIYVQDSIADKFIEGFKAALSTVKAGDPLDSTTMHGPQADHVQRDIVQKYIQIGKESGAEVVLGGEKYEGIGNFVLPTVFKNMPEDARMMREEVFGSVVNINTFKTDEEALAKANDTEYGLYASVFTKNIDRALKFAKGMEAGTVAVNAASPTTTKDLPFGGYKASGTGRVGMAESLDHYLETKTVVIKTG